VTREVGVRKVIVFNMMSLDGFFEGPIHDISWHNVDEEFNEFALEQIDSADTLLFGRITYQLMEGYWPTDEARRSDPVVADRMNMIHKIVFSRNLRVVQWSNTQLFREDAAIEVARLKQQPGKDMLVFGSADLTASLTRAGVVDEYRVMVNPIVLGHGEPLFKDVTTAFLLELLSFRTFRNGNVLLSYRPEPRV
jgi:dihydrofolate reductase